MLAFLRIAALVGLVVFVPVMLAAALAPHHLERAARDFAVSEVRKKVDGHLETPAGRLLATAYERLAKKLAEERNATEEQLVSGFAERMASILAELCNLDCKKKKRLKASIELGLKSHIALLDKSIAKIKALEQRTFDDVMGKIRRDLIIFSGSNSLVFGILLALTFARRDYARPLLLPGILMLVSTAAAMSIYVFGQNWFFAILTDSYMGFGYLAYIATIFLFLSDIVLNRARITLRILDALASLTGSTASAC